MITVVVPALNEERGIALTINSIRDSLTKGRITRFQIIVVDDGSRDRTAQIAVEHGAEVIHHVHNLGYGRSLKDGIAAARYDTVAIVDADGTYPIARLPEFIEEYNKGYDLIVGRRQGAHYHESWLKRPLRAILKFLVEFTTGQAIPDINSGMRVFSRNTMLPYFDQLCNTFSFTTSQTMAFMLTGRFIGYVPIEYHSRIGEKKVKLFRDSLRTLQYIVQSVLYYNPFKLFLLISFGIFFLSVSSLLVNLLGGSQLAGILGGIGVFVAILVFTLGLLADQMRQILIKIQYETREGSVIRGHSIVSESLRVANER